MYKRQIQSSDWLLLLCAVLFSFQIMAVDHFSPQMDGVRPVSYTHLDVYKRQAPALWWFCKTM